MVINSSEAGLTVNERLCVTLTHVFVWSEADNSPVRVTFKEHVVYVFARQRIEGRVQPGWIALLT